METKDLLKGLEKMLTTEQINTDEEDLYDASADRYKKKRFDGYWMCQSQKPSCIPILRRKSANC